MPRLAYMVTKQMMCLKKNPITVIFCNCPEMKIYGTLNKHPGFQQRSKMIQK